MKIWAALAAVMLFMFPAHAQEMKAEGYGRAAASKYELSVSAEVRKLTSGDAVLVKYKTNLPQKTVLYMTVRALGQVLVTRKQTVEGPTFAIRFGPFDDKSFAPGIYVVDVSCLPSRQESASVKEELAGMDDLVASAELRVGSPEEYEVTTLRRKAELTSELEDLAALYSAINTEYVSQKKDFDGERWEAFSASWKEKIGAIRQKDIQYRARMLVMDYAAQENIKMMMVDTLDKLWTRYMEDLSQENGLGFKAPPSPDNRPAEMLKSVMQELLVNSDSFVLTFSKQKD